MMMSNCTTSRWELKCGYILKILIICVATAGIILSYFASNTCQFLYFESEEGGSWMGIFKHDSTSNSTIQEEKNEMGSLLVTEGCFVYDRIFDLDAPTEILFIIQLCAVIAPSLAFIGILISILELFFCQFLGSFVTTSILFLAASVVQSGTFGIFLIDPVLIYPGLCFDTECEIGDAVYFSASSAFAYFISCVLLCCSPRPIPCLQQDCGNRNKKYDGLSSIARIRTSLPPPSIAATNETLNYDDMEARRQEQ